MSISFVVQLDSEKKSQNYSSASDSLKRILTIFYLSSVTTKAVAGAKSLGNFLYSAVNKAGAKVSEASAKIKETVEKNVCT